MFDSISVAGWKPVDNSAGSEINEEEVHALFNLIDADKTGVITPQVFIEISKNKFKKNATIDLFTRGKGLKIQAYDGKILAEFNIL